MNTSQQTAPGGAHPHPSAAARRSARRGVILCGGLAAAWALLIRTFGDGDVYPVLGPFAVAVVAVVIAIRAKTLAQELEPTARAVVSGLLVGVVMAAATYPVFDWVSSLVPGLRSHVAYLYRAAATRTVWQSLPWVVVIILAEEFLFRGALLEAFERRFRVVISGALCVVIYVLAQAGTGSGIVALMALVCGSIWTVQRHLTRSLLSPLISHLIWTPTVILLRPVL